MKSECEMVINEIYLRLEDSLLNSEVPSESITRIAENAEFIAHPFIMLVKLKDTGQSPKYHPEGSVWNHTMLVVDEAAKVMHESTNQRAFMWAALLHDIGKPATTRIRKGRITSYDHDKEGALLCREFLSYFSDDEGFISYTSSLVRYHMHMLYVLKNLPHGNILGLLREVDIHDIALLCKCDRLGRAGADRSGEEADYQNFLSRLISYV